MAVQSVSAVAVVTRSPGSEGMAFSPKKSPATTKRIMASLPVDERTGIFGRFFEVEDTVGWISLRKKAPSLAGKNRCEP
jgi:hypothetical protein